jgi:hypothetical protein
MNFEVSARFPNCKNPLGRAVGALLAIAPIWLLAGCGADNLQCHEHPVAKSSRAHSGFQSFDQPPKARIGSIPCPGPFTFFATADPRGLGTHAYGSGRNELSRGIVYTTRGGFIDIAHVRKAADWSAYHHLRFKRALEEGRPCIVLSSKERTTYHVKFNHPAFWAALPDTKRRQVIDELSIRLAQRLAITQSEWHEIATWFGFSNTMYPEKPSALTYDDMTSHVLGATVAGMALRDTSRDYNTAVTHHLKRELDRLGPVSPDQTLKALGMVENKWWRNGVVIKRQLDIGEGDGTLAPWIVPGYPGGGTATGIPFAIPSLKDVVGLNLSGFEQVEINPRIGAWSAMRRVLPGNPDRCRPAEHFPLLLRHIRRQEGAN